MFQRSGCHGFPSHPVDRPEQEQDGIMIHGQQEVSECSHLLNLRRDWLRRYIGLKENPQILSETESNEV